YAHRRYIPRFISSPIPVQRGEYHLTIVLFCLSLCITGDRFAQEGCGSLISRGSLCKSSIPFKLSGSGFLCRCLRICSSKAAFRVFHINPSGVHSGPLLLDQGLCLIRFVRGRCHSSCSSVELAAGIDKITSVEPVLRIHA